MRVLDIPCVLLYVRKTVEERGLSAPTRTNKSGHVLSIGMPLQIV